MLKNAGANRQNHMGFTGCGKSRIRRALYQGTTSVVPISRLFLPSRSGFSPRETCFYDFFRSLFSPGGRQRSVTIQRISVTGR
jgi:hypothetical protein